MGKNFFLIKPYTKAIFILAKENNRFQEWEDLLQILSLAMQNKDVVKYCKNANIDLQTKLTFLLDICAVNKINLLEMEVNFLQLLLRKQYIIFLPQIFALYKEFLAAQQKKMLVKVASAFALSEGLQLQLRKTLRQYFRKELDLDYVVDSSLIGGLVIYYGGKVIDGSVRGKLEQFREALEA
jgi:F-type H+-transporting ATPase subunit delta